MGGVDRARAVKAELFQAEEAAEASNDRVVLASLAETWMHQNRKEALDAATALAERLAIERRAVEESRKAGRAREKRIASKSGGGTKSGSRSDSRSDSRSGGARRSSGKASGRPAGRKKGEVRGTRRDD